MKIWDVSLTCSIYLLFLKVEKLVVVVGSHGGVGATLTLRLCLQHLSTSSFSYSTSERHAHIQISEIESGE